MSKPVRVGIFGIGGYAHEHLTVITTLQEFGFCQLIAAADPFAASRPETANALRAGGVDVLEDPAQLLARDDIDAVFIATPLHMHTPQALAAMQAGKHVYLEKPPCPTIGQWQQLVAAQEKSGKVFVVGFQMQTTPGLRFARRRLQEGAIGKLQMIWASARWRREDGYYNRAPWSGRWSVDGQPVFDGPATNALAHVVHATHSLAPSTGTVPTIARVRGALKKARPLESFDTSYIETETTEGVSVRLIFTHATPHSDEVVIRAEGSEGTLELSWNGRVAIESSRGESETYLFPQRPSSAVVLDFFRAINGEGQPFTPIQNTLPFLQAVNGALQSSKGSSLFPADKIEFIAEGTPQHYYTVHGLDEQIAAFQSKPELIPPLLTSEPMPWIEAKDISPDLVVN